MTLQPLTGVKVIDLTQVMLGPCATQFLGDFGADVVKIERPGQGDLSRWSIPDPAGLDNPVFCSLNRNKRSVALNLKHETGREIVREMARSADVVVNNFRPDVMERMGLGYERLSGENPRIIYAFGTGFGKSGPYSHKGGQDVLAQAMTGVMARKADPEHPLAIYATALADYSAAMHLVQGILLALLHREKTGRGQMVDVSLYDSMLSMQTQEASMWLMRKEDLNWAAMPLSGVFETRDGALVLVGAFKENPLRDISAALEIEDLSREERFSTMERMRANRSELQGIFRKRFREAPTAHWIERLEAQDLLCSPVKSLREALEDPQTRENQMLVETVDGRSDVRLVGTPVHLSSAPLEVRHAPPGLGEHTDSVLRELGYDAARIAGLRAEGVVA
ncbi:MAG TPA: CaiB/BaiF CoA-transferase family protein [Vicinamibacteria bacterium]|nr:CaiB/BaiF CoA-transferase family protein [Vicinamibacteria bacterium]